VRSGDSRGPSAVSHVSFLPSESRSSDDVIAGILTERTMYKGNGISEVLVTDCVTC
jgi:hypothetical protein